MGVAALVVFNQYCVNSRVIAGAVEQRLDAHYSDTTSRDEIATTTCAETKGFEIIRLLGTPREVHSCSLAALT